MIKEEIEEMKKEVQSLQEHTSEKSLATLVINKLIKVIFALIIFILINNIAWFWYISLPIEESEYTQTIEDIENSNESQRIGE